MKKNLKKLKEPSVIAITVIIVLSLVLFALRLFIGDCTLRGKFFVNKIDNLCMIDFDRLGNYDDYKYQFHRESVFVFTTYTYVLTAEYSPDEYKNQVDYINNNYSFYTEPVFHESFDYEILGQIDFYINGWNVKAVCGENLDYPHHMHFIAFNNDSDKIAYLEFSDSDFDGLEKDDDMESFFKDYFNYTFK